MAAHFAPYCPVQFLGSISNKKYISTHRFYTLRPFQNMEKLRKIITFSKTENIELMVHPNRNEEFNFMQSDLYSMLINSTKFGNFTMLKRLLNKQKLIK